MKEELGIALQHYRIVPYGSEAAELHSLAPLGMEVMLNGQQVDHEPHPLSDRDTITTGDLKLIFRLSDPALDEIKPTALLEKKFVGETPTGQAAREIAASDAPVPVFQTPAPVAGQSHLTPLALESLENVEPSGPGQLPEVSPFTALEAAPVNPVLPTQEIEALPTVAAPASHEEVAPLPVAVEAAPQEPLPQVAPIIAAEEVPASPVAPAAAPPVATAPTEHTPGSLPQVNPLPVSQEVEAPVSPPSPEPVAATPPALPVSPDPVPVAPPLPGEPSPIGAPVSAAPAPNPSAHSARPAELFLPKKDAPKLATDAGIRADAARRTSARWGFQALGIFAAAAWILVAIYAFVDPARNIIHDLIGFDPLAGEKIEQIEATVDAKNPAPAGAVEKTETSGVVDQD
ncbi:hypothetical protein OAF27_02495 [Verrucomicrobiales bacterium]|nr:hypothetical protein [Verrucomicrobiales bacterium]